MAKEVPHRRDFLVGFLVVFSMCSLLLNAALLLDISHPSFWRDLRLSRLHPPAVRASDHIRGRANAPMTIIEYADFQCPYCRKMHASLQAAVNAGEIRWVYREYPTASIHPLAFKEAEAAECAGEQGKFWEFADALFGTQAELGSSQIFDHELASLAQSMGIAPEELNQCLASGRFEEAIKRAISEAETLQIRGTPTIFIDNKRHEGAVSYDILEKLLKDHLT